MVISFQVTEIKSSGPVHTSQSCRVEFSSGNELNSTEIERLNRLPHFCRTCPIEFDTAETRRMNQASDFSTKRSDRLTYKKSRTKHSEPTG